MRVWKEKTEERNVIKLKSPKFKKNDKKKKIPHCLLIKDGKIQ